MPLVSVVIPAYNCSRTLGKAIDSALAQDIPLEVLVLDDCGAESLAEIIKLLCFDRVGPAVALVVCVTLVAAMVVANLVGSGLPVLAKRLGLDPTVTASPLITTIVDAVALMIYFNIAKLVLGI